MSILRKAHDFAEKAHEGQKRKYTGRPYIEHPKRVAFQALARGGNRAFIMGAVGYLHDVVEDCGISLDQIKAEFGPDVADLVNQLTKPEYFKNLKRAEKHAELLNISKTWTVEAKILKMIDRLDNLKEILGAPVDFVTIYCKESAELAEAIGDADKTLKASILSQINHVKIKLHLD